MKKAKPAAPLSPAREVLAAHNALVATARGRVHEIEERVSRLRGVIAAEAPAQEELQAAVAADDGASLSRLARGGQAGNALDELVAQAEAASRAATVARSATPRAEAELAGAVGEVERLTIERVKLVGAVLIEDADPVGREYRETFKKLCALHDHLAGISRGVAPYGVDLVMTIDTLSAPRFALPSHPPAGSHFDPYLRHRPDEFAIKTTAAEWIERSQQLAAEPSE
jgi:hypothetical protein